MSKQFFQTRIGILLIFMFADMENPPSPRITSAMGSNPLWSSISNSINTSFSNPLRILLSCKHVVCCCHLSVCCLQSSFACIIKSLILSFNCPAVGGQSSDSFQAVINIEQLCKLKGFSVLFNLFFPKFCWLRPNYAEQHLSNEKIPDIWLWVCRLVHKQRTNWWEVCLRLLRGLGPIMVPHTSISVNSHVEHNVAESKSGADFSKNHQNLNFKVNFRCQKLS